MVTKQEEHEVGREGSYPAFSEMVEVFQTNGIRVWNSVEGDKNQPDSTHFVQFSGGDSEGMKAVALAVRHGFKIEYLKRAWYFWDDNRLQGNGSWEMTIHANDVRLQGFNHTD